MRLIDSLFRRGWYYVVPVRQRHRRGRRVAAAAQATRQGLTFTPSNRRSNTRSRQRTKPQCTIQPEKENNGTAWVVRNRQGEMLRRFADTNSDNVVDLWCYYLDGIEVYRDIDSNFNNKADQYRWFNTAGTRWGIDKNEDGRIDAWQTISPHEVAEQVVIAIKTRDPARFNLLLATPDELNDLGLGKQRADQLSTAIRTAGERFRQVGRRTKAGHRRKASMSISAARGRPRYQRERADRPSDVTVCDNASALDPNRRQA